MSTVKDLQDLTYFNDHPNELPENQDLIDKLLAGEKIPTKSSLLAGDGAGDGADEGADAEATAKAEAEAKAAADAAAKATADAAAKAKAGDDAQKGAVATKDGTGTIPYEVLQGARQRGEAEKIRADEAEQRERDANTRAAAAEKTAQVLEARAAELDAAAKAGKPASGKSTDTDEIREQINAMREDLPAMAGILEKLLARVDSSEAKAARLEAKDKVNDDAEAEVVRDEVQVQIDSNPSLALWQEKHPKVFDRACAIDDRLKEDPVWGSKPITDRFAKVVRDVLEEMPDAPKPEAQAPGKKDVADPAAGKDVQAKIEAALARASKKAPVTLSDMRGGEAPGPDELADIEAISVDELAVAMAKMPASQLEAFLGRYGG